MQNNRTYQQKKASGKSKKKAVSDDYLAEVLKKMEAQSQKERHKKIVLAGKELVLLCLFLKSVGLIIESDIPTSVASLLKDYPEALKEVLAFIEDYGQKPVLGKKLIQGFNTSISDGQLKIHFLWKTSDLQKMESLAQKLDGQGD